jgi:DNA-binding beta-propeller fold protein YncE
MRFGFLSTFCLPLGLSLAMATTAHAQTVLSANDGHSILRNGVQVLPSPLKPDTLSVLGRGSNGLWAVRDSVAVPVSVVGPPTALVLTPDGQIALVSSATKADPAHDRIVPDDRISVVDLSGATPRVIQQVTSAPGTTTLRITPDRKHVLVANGAGGVVTWFRFDGRRLSDRRIIALPIAAGFPGGLAITPDGKRALVSLWKGDRVFVLHLDGDDVTIDPQPLEIGPGPWNIRLTRDGHYAVMGILGHGEGLPGALSVLDLTATPIREIQRVIVPNAPEGLDISADGRFVAVVSQNGSAVVPTSPRYHDRGIVTVFSLSAGHLAQLAQAPGTLWPQGLVFAPDGTSILVQGVMDRMLRTLSWDGTTLAVKGDTPLPGGGANIERQR